MEIQIVNILWTGGWDSTYRVVQLSMRDIEIQPIYVEDVGRKSVPYELQAMKDIVSLLEAKAETNAEFLPLKKNKITDIPADQDISQAYLRIKKQVNIGTQYEYLARLAKTYPGIEIGIEKPNGEYSGCVAAIEKNGCLIRENDISRVDKANSNTDCNLVFGNFTFPIIDINEIEMVERIKKWKCEDVMKHIWFCHKPIESIPCGYCRPCQQKMECGMEWLLPIESQKRYKCYKCISKVFGNKFGTKAVNRYYRK